MSEDLSVKLSSAITRLIAHSLSGLKSDLVVRQLCSYLVSMNVRLRDIKRICAKMAACLNVCMCIVCVFHCIYMYVFIVFNLYMYVYPIVQH